MCNAGGTGLGECNSCKKQRTELRRGERACVPQPIKGETLVTAADLAQWPAMTTIAQVQTAVRGAHMLTVGGMGSQEAHRA